MVKKFDPVQSKWALQIISDNYISQTVVQLQYSMNESAFQFDINNAKLCGGRIKTFLVFWNN